MMVRESKGKWNLPNSHLHWPIGKKIPQPSEAARQLLKELTYSLVDEKPKERKILPSGGFLFIFEPNEITRLVSNVECVSKHLGLEKNVQMHAVDPITEISAHFTYGPDTIESVRWFKEK